MKNNSHQPVPTRAQSLIFRGKASLLQTKRAAMNFFDSNLKRFRFNTNLKDKPVIAESKTLLWTEKEPKEQFLLAGKVHNLRLAVKRLNELEIPAGEIFSFWQHVGKTSHRKGYVAGRELREGCIIPNIGGGLCQISNALYDAALKAKFEIVERHAHTQVVRGSLAEQNRDATVFWNYVDLRFKSPTAFRIEARLDAQHLTVRFKSDKRNINQSFKVAKDPALNRPDSDSPTSCATCGVYDCFRAVKPPAEYQIFGRTAFLLDEFSPELDNYIQEKKTEKDFLFVPLDGHFFKKANYAWTISGFTKVKQSLFVTALRSYRSRKLAAQGAARQTNLLAMYEKLAKSYADNLPFDALHLVVQQNLLPFLWRAGVLGGRTFDVLMTALPMKDLQERLDFAKSLHPDSQTLGDFRAENRLLGAESEALDQARKIITPHTEIASLFPEKSVVVDWHLPVSLPRSKTQNSKPVIVFPASTVGRKGAYELREALRKIDVKIIILGANIESDDFWEGFEAVSGSFKGNWLAEADLVVLPAFVEHKPRRLLQAVAANIPVIASKACGLENVRGVETFAAGDVIDLRERILKQLFAEKAPQKKITQAAKSSVIFSK